MKVRGAWLAALVFAGLAAEPALAACEASVWQSYRGTELWRFTGSEAYFYKTKRMEIDADGAPDAYHPDDKGIDALANAGYPRGGWKAVLVQDPADPAKPYLQPSGEFAGYFLSRTTLEDKSLPPTDPRRYVNASTVPYLVFPGQFYQLKDTGAFGDVGMARNLTGDKETPFVIADAGPSRAPLGEVSMRLAVMLGGKNVKPRTGVGKPTGEFVYVIFPKSKSRPPWSVSIEEMQTRAAAALAAVGGWERILACAR